MSKDYYTILGVSKNASNQDIKQAYRKLAHKYHPDKKGGDEKKFKQINEAYQVLSNDQKRAQYDQFGSAFPGQGGPSGAWGNGNFEDIFRNFGGFRSANFDFDDIFSFFSGSPGGQKRTREYKSKAKDIVVDLEITLEEIYNRANKEIKLRKNVKCPKCNSSGREPGSAMKKCSTCNGNGEIHQTQKTIFGSFSRITVCPDCHGEGEIPEKACTKCRGRGTIKDVQAITINVPAGVDDGQIIKLERQGEAGGKGIIPGNLYIRIHLEKHKDFTKKGNDIYYELPIKFTQAALGDKVEIPTLEKKVKLKIPSGVESGKLLRIKNKGLPQADGSRGDQLVKIKINTPEKLSKKERELLEKLKKEGL